ncbi:PspC domain-containing protein [Paenarthrobacter ilicis]|uniref:PspC domain-containing protein n=1 Tax=Paenarthrobacter ilicis TaxID=43665 RepID=UPI0028D89706|nr:PspC domain-containing protein [Paenarthrobacter ilicis]
MNANSMNPEEPGTPGTPSGSGSSAYHGADAAPGESQQNFFDWIRNLGIRRGPDRWVGGVASGVAHRFGIDPVIVRGIFIVLAVFAGVGVLLYGLAWALLPEPDGRIHVQEAAAGRWSSGMTGALIATIIGLPSLGRGFWGWGWNGLPGLFWTLFWVGGTGYLIYYLVQRNKASRTMPPAGQGAGASTATASTAHTYTASTAPTYTASTNTGVPVYGPTFGQSGPPNPSSPPNPSGPFNPSGPRPPSGPTPPRNFQPKPAAPKRQGPGAAIVAVSAGAALLVGGTLKALDAGNVIDLGNSVNAVVFASGAAVLGLGIVVAGLRGRTSGFLGFLAVVALIIGGIFNLMPRNGDRFTFHDVNWAPTSVDQARTGINITGSQGRLDLSKLTLAAPLTSPVTIPVDATASNVTVVIPDNVPVEVRADMTFGNLNERGSDRGGRFQDDTTMYNSGKPGATLVVEIDGTFSNVTIQGGN